MQVWSAVLMSSLLAGQNARPVFNQSPEPPAPRLKLRRSSLTPQQMIRAMVAQDQARRKRPGATVEVIGYDDEAALKRLSMKVKEKVRLEFRNTDTLHARELYAFMHQDPSHPNPVLISPVLAGGPVARAEDKWLK